MPKSFPHERILLTRTLESLVGKEKLSKGNENNKYALRLTTSNMTAEPGYCMYDELRKFVYITSLTSYCPPFGFSVCGLI